VHVGLLCGPAASEELPKAEENNCSQRFEEEKEGKRQFSYFGFYRFSLLREKITTLNNKKKPHFNL